MGDIRPHPTVAFTNRTKDVETAITLPFFKVLFEKSDPIPRDFSSFFAEF
jgi:hypothetical protein